MTASKKLKTPFWHANCIRKTQGNTPQDAVAKNAANTRKDFNNAYGTKTQSKTL